MHTFELLSKLKNYIYINKKKNRRHVICLYVCFRWFQLGTNPYTGSQDWIYSGGYFNRNYQDLPDIYWMPASLHHPHPPSFVALQRSACVKLGRSVENPHTHFIPICISLHVFKLRHNQHTSACRLSLQPARCLLSLQVFLCFFSPSDQQAATFQALFPKHCLEHSNCFIPERPQWRVAVVQLAATLTGPVWIFNSCTIKLPPEELPAKPLFRKSHMSLMSKCNMK